MTTPAVRSIRQNFPAAKISILTYPWVADVFAASPHIDEIIIFDKKGRHAGLTGLYRLGRELAARHFDVAILLQNAFVAAVIARLAGIPVRAGYRRDGRSLLLTHPVRIRKEVRRIHQVHYYQTLLQDLGLDPGPDSLFLQLSQDAEQWAAAQAAAWRRPLVGLNPGAAYGPAKRWPAEKYGQLAAMLAREMDATMLVFGTDADHEAAADIARLAPDRVIDLTGRTTLARAMAMIAQCDAFVTNDSGLMHVAAALQTPLAAIFGSTDDVATGPFSERAVVIKKNMDCSPCLKTECSRDFRCMLDISPEDVLAAVRGLIAYKREGDNG